MNAELDDLLLRRDLGDLDDAGACRLCALLADPAARRRLVAHAQLSVVCARQPRTAARDWRQLAVAASLAVLLATAVAHVWRAAPPPNETADLPAQADLLLWLRPGALTQEGGRVAAWRDGSGHGNDAVQTVDGWRPEPVADGVRFAGDGQHLCLPDLPADAFTAGATVVAAVTLAELRPWQRLLDLGNGERNHNLVIGWRHEPERPHLSTCGAQLDVAAPPGGYLDGEKGSTTGRRLVLAWRITGDGRAAIWQGPHRVAEGSVPPPTAVLRRRNFLGRSNWSDSPTSAMTVHALALYRRALDDAEVTTAMRLLADPVPPAPPTSASAPAAPAPLPRLLAHWQPAATHGALVPERISDRVGWRSGDAAPQLVAGGLRLARGEAITAGRVPWADRPALTLCARVRPETNDVADTAEDKGRTIIDIGGPWPTGIFLNWHGDGRFIACHSAARLVRTDAAFPAGRWYHVAAVFTRDATRIVVDGRDAAAGPGAFALADPLEVALGRFGDRSFAGVLGDVQVYDGALTPAQLAALAAP